MGELWKRLHARVCVTCTIWIKAEEVGKTLTNNARVCVCVVWTLETASACVELTAWWLSLL